MSYATKRHKIFNEAGGDAQIQRKHSDGRMKTYNSATDLRAWSDLNEERRQYILDLVRKGGGKSVCFGKYIPLEAIVDILIADKNAAIERLQRENIELRKMTKTKSVTIVQPVTESTEISEQSFAQFKGKPAGKKVEDLFIAASNLRTSSSDYNYPSSSEEELNKNLTLREKEVAALREALKEQEKLCHFHERAIEQLENIKNIVESPKSSRSKEIIMIDDNTESCKNEIDLLEQEIKEMENSSSREQAIIQRELQVLKKYCEKLSLIQKENSTLKKDQDSLQNRLEKLDQGFPDSPQKERYADLERRLERVKGLEDEVLKLKQFANNQAEKDKLIASLQQELEDLKRMLKEMEEALKASKVEQDDKSVNVDTLSGERDNYKTKCENLECECEALISDLQKASEFQNEKRLLLKEIEDCECGMSNQESEIKRLIGQVDCLSKELNERERKSIPPNMVEAITSCSRFQNICTPTQTSMSQPQITQQSLEEKACAIKRVIELENKLLLKQNHTRKNMEALQQAFKIMKQELDTEKQRNRDLMSKYTNQTKTVTNMKIEIAIVKKRNFLDKEKLKRLNLLLSNILQNYTCQCPREIESQAAIEATSSNRGPHANEERSFMESCGNDKTTSASPCDCTEKELDSFKKDKE